MNLKKVLLLILVLLILGCAIYVGSAIVKYNKYLANSDEALTRLSGRLGVEKDWDIIRNEIYCNVISDGSTIEEIEEQLNGITQYKMQKNDDNGFDYAIYFLEPYVKLDDMKILLDSNYRVREKTIWIGLGDVGEINCSSE